MNYSLGEVISGMLEIFKAVKNCTLFDFSSSIEGNFCCLGRSAFEANVDDKFLYSQTANRKFNNAPMRFSIHLGAGLFI